MFQHGFHRLRHQIVFVAVFFRGQQFVSGFAIQHIVRLTTRRAGQRQRAEMCPLFAQQQLRARPQQHTAVFERNVEVKTCRVLRDQAFQQRTAVDVPIGGDINQAREHHFIDLRCRSEGGGAGDHLFKYGLRRDFRAAYDRQFLRAGMVACGFLSRRTRKSLPALRNKQ
ncbi:hypothetical protein D3C87_1679840 [compost metagenome]